MQFLAIEIAVEGVGEAEFTPEIGAAEARRVWDLHQAGTVREPTSGPIPPQPCSCSNAGTLPRRARLWHRCRWWPPV